MAEKSYKFSISINQLNFFLEKIHDLLTIDDEVLIKITKDNILLYSMVGEKMSVNAFKSFIFKTEEVFSFVDELSKEIRFIITNGSKFESTLKNYLDFAEDINCEFFMNDDTYADNFRLQNSKLKLNMTGGDVRGMNTTIDIDKIKNTLNKNNIDFKFILDKNLYLKIKKMASIVPDSENEILTLTINKNVLSIGESFWDLKICDLEHEDLTITFPKKYFKSITFTDDNVDVFIFDTFLLIDNQNTNLLIALELSV
jgi:hypothetical protein